MRRRSTRTPAPLFDVHEAVATLEDVTRIARRLFGGAHTRSQNGEQSHIAEE